MKRLAARLVEYELPIVAALGPIFVFPGDYVMIGLVPILGLWLCRWWVRGQLTLRTPAADAGVLLMLLALPGGLWASVDLFLSWPLFYRIVWGIALFYAVVNGVRSERQARWAVAGLLLVVAALCPVALVGTNWARTKLMALPGYNLLPALITDASRFPGGAFHPNVIAGTLAPFIPLALALLLLVRPGGRRAVARYVLLGAFVLLLGAIVLLTQSRGGWVGLAAGLLALALLSVPGRHPLRWALPVALAGLGIAVALVWRYGWAGLFLQLDSTGSGASRLEVWNRALYMIRDMPFTGIGLGTFQPILNAFYPSFLAGPDADIPHAHQMFLQVAVDLGLPGLLGFMLLFGSALGAALLAYRRGARGSWARALGVGLLGALAVVAVHGLFDATLWAARSSPLLWVLLGLAVAAWRLAGRDTGHESQMNTDAHG